MINSSDISRAVAAAVFLWGALISAAPLFASGTGALAELVAEAEANNPELRSMREVVKAREAGARAEGSFEDPSLKIERMGLPTDNLKSSGQGNAMQTRYTLSQAFPFPGKLSLKEKAAMKGAAATRSELAAKTLDVASLVKEAWFDYAYLEASEAINAEVKLLLASMARVAQTRYSTGLSPQQDIIRVQIEEAMLTGEVLTISAGKEAVSARLKYIIGRQQDTALDLDDATLVQERVTFSVDELIKKAVINNPQITSRVSLVEVAEATTELSRKAYYPDIMVGAGPVQTADKFDSYDVMLQINIPIWFGKYDLRTQEASADAASMRSMLMAERNLKAYEVKQAAIEVQTAEKMLDLYSTGILPQTQMSFESGLKNYQSGKVDFLTLIESERNLKATRLEYLKTLLEYRKKVAALEKAVGEDF